MTEMGHLPLMELDHNDQLAASSRQVRNDGTPETTYYVYDAEGQRVRKVTEFQAGEGNTPLKKNERIYLGGFEVYREYKGDKCSLERQSLHVMDDEQRIALVETKIVDTNESDGLGVPLVRYQLGNHLGSASLELDGKGALISYEEYHPYGTTAFQLYAQEVSRKRYRYTGMERDEETGLNYHGARYYALWLGRWCSCDPIGIEDGLNIYTYVVNNPVNKVDPDGKEWIDIPGGKLEPNQRITSEKIKSINIFIKDNFRKYNGKTYHKKKFNCLHLVRTYVLGLMFGKIYKGDGSTIDQHYMTKIRDKVIYDIWNGIAKRDQNAEKVFPKDRRKLKKDGFKLLRRGTIIQGVKVEKDGWYIVRKTGGNNATYKLVTPKDGIPEPLKSGDRLDTVGGTGGPKDNNPKLFNVRHKLFVVIKGNKIELWGSGKTYGPEEQGFNSHELKKMPESFYNRRIITRITRVVRLAR